MATDRNKPTPGPTVEDVGRANAAAVLSAVLVAGPLARAEIAERVGLTRATVTRVANRLIEAGLLVETAPRRDNPGRPLVPLALAGSARAVISVHIGVLESRVGLVDLHGRVVVELRDRYTDPDPAHIVSVIAGRVADVIADHGGTTRVLGVGASVGGWVDPDAGVVMRFDPLAWENVPLAELLATATGLPVRLDQVARGLVRAERMYGAARDVDDLLLIWVGHILEAALVTEGRIRFGAHGAGGTLAHFPVRVATAPCACGRTGCLAALATDQAIMAEAVRRGLAPEQATMRDLGQLSGVSWTGVAQFVSEVGAVAGESVAAMADLLNPSVVLLAGLVTTLPTYMDAFAARLGECVSAHGTIQVRGSTLGDMAPTVGSAATLLGPFFADPFGFESSLGTGCGA